VSFQKKTYGDIYERKSETEIQLFRGEELKSPGGRNSICSRCSK